MEDPNTSRNAGLYTNYREAHTYHIQQQRQMTQLKFSICLGFCYWVRVDITRLVCNQNLILCSCNSQGSASPVHGPERKMAVWTALVDSFSKSGFRQLNRARDWTKSSQMQNSWSGSNENNVRGGYGTKIALLRPIKWLNYVIANT